MESTSIIDSHIHLWPQSMSNEEGHSWMTKGMPLAKEHLLKHYCNASEPTVEGVVYVETDVRYDAPSSDLSSWTKGPLDEIRFLRDIVEGIYGERDSQTLLAIVAWAPMDQPTSVLEEWLSLAEETAGPETWKRVKGFRFLLQGITDQAKFEALVFSDVFIANLKLLGRRGFSFDIGVDHHSEGIWQLEGIAEAMRLAHQDVPDDDEKVVFILNHLCKPDFRSDKFEEWRDAMNTLARIRRTYMKLSGAFSELPDEVLLGGDIAAYLKPWVSHVFECFGAERVMFGSDWPVCNVKGPKGEDSWPVWKDVVSKVLQERKLGKREQERVWRGTAVEAYKIS